MKDHRTLPYFTIVVTILLLVCGLGVVLGQGGTGREAPKTSTPPKKTTPARTPPVKKTAPSFRPTNPRIELVRIPPGGFMMGSTNGGATEKPVHQVTISQAFYMGKYEVTQGQWQAVMGNNPSNFKDCANCPVEQVSWDDAQKFIQRLNQTNDGYIYRLPTEAEWEYACRAGTTGDYAGNLSEMAWYSENSGSKTHSVGGKRPNDWGLADMHGNVWEWCQDWYHETYYGAPTDGSAWLSGGEQKYRVLRGGSWLDTNAPNLRSASRNTASPDYRGSYIGFRVVAIARTQAQAGAEKKSNTNPTSGAGSIKNPSLPAPATLDADPVLFPPDTRNLQSGDPKPKSTAEPATEKVFQGKEVDQRAQILDKPKPFYTDSARTNLVGGTVVLRAVLASSGQVTNIRVIRGLPNGLTEQAIAAAKKVKFTPAMKDGQAVSQEIQFEYNFSPY